MTATEYAAQVISDTASMRPTHPDTVRFTTAENDKLGRFTLELSAQRVFLTSWEAISDEAHDFLYDTARALEASWELSDLSAQVAA